MSLRPDPRDPEKIWEDFWLPMFESLGAAPPRYDLIIAEGRQPIGKRSAQWQKFLAQVKLELSDYEFMMKNTSEAFCELSGNMISKPMTLASEVVGCNDDMQQEQSVDHAKDFLENVDPDLTVEELLAAVREHWNVPAKQETE